MATDGRPSATPGGRQSIGKIRSVGAWPETESLAMKDIRRAFALYAPVLLIILAILPAWSSLALLHSSTYLYFVEKSIPIGGIILASVLLLAFWLHVVLGVPLPDFFPKKLLPVCGCTICLHFVPTECFVMLGVLIFLLMVWKLLPIVLINGFASATSFAWRIFSMLWLNSCPAASILASCIACVVLYVLSLNYFFTRTRHEVSRDVKSLFTMWCVFVLTFGASLIIFALPLSYDATRSYNQLQTRCETGSRTTNLFLASQALQSLRQMPACMEKVSIEECSGFAMTTFAKTLKDMEFEYKCSGFCYNPSLIDALSTENLQVSSSALSLFSKANFEASCDGMAARSMYNFVGQIGKQILHHGILLVVVVLTVVVLHLIGLCRRFEGVVLGGPSVTDNENGYGSVK